MNFNELQLIIRYIRKTVLCSHCSAKYATNDIEILSTFDDQGLIHLNCSHCSTQVMVHVTLSDQEAKITQKNPSSTQKLTAQSGLPERTHQRINSKKEVVSLNDVIDMHGFLSGFNGDFKNLFSKTKQS